MRRGTVLRRRTRCEDEEVGGTTENMRRRTILRRRRRCEDEEEDGTTEEEEM